LPVELNEWLYRIGRRNVIRFLAHHGIRAPLAGRVLDVGAGTGYWTALWLAMGAREVDGYDLVPLAVERLRRQFPGGRFNVGDLSEPNAFPPDVQYDFVTAMNVLLHITDDTGFEHAAQNLATVVAPGGHLLIADAAIRHGDPRTRSRQAASRTRLVTEYKRALEENGVQLLAIGASTVIGANPIDAPSRLALAAWSVPWRAIRLVSALGSRPAAAAGRVTAGLDRVLMQTGAAPSGKLMLFRRGS
jgi:SAM-dependent methyltransferase